MSIKGVNSQYSFMEEKKQGKPKSTSNSFADTLLSTEEMMQTIRDKKSEILEKVKKGETEPVIQIGAQAYTEKQWKRMLESFDDSEKDIKDMIREALEKYKKEQQAKEAGAM